MNSAKSSPAKLNVKGFSVKKALEENSPVKRSPVMKLHRQEGQYFSFFLLMLNLPEHEILNAQKSSQNL